MGDYFISIFKSLGSAFSKLALFTDRVRDSFIEHRTAGIGLLLILTVVLGYGNWVAFKIGRGNILDNPILNKEDPAYIRDKYAKTKTEFSDSFKVGIKCPNGITKESLKRLIIWTERFREEFDIVVSFSYGISDITKVGDTLYVDPYLTLKGLETLDIGRWKRHIRNDPTYGLLIELDWSCLFIIVILERGYNDTDVLWRISELLEEREIPWWERLWKTDIFPKDPDLFAAGWPVARALLYQILNVDMVVGVSFGLSLVLILFWFALRSLRQALYSAGVVVLSMMFMRGTIGILRLSEIDIIFLGLPIRETVYILSALTVCIVQGVSFSLHKFEAYNRTGNWKGAKVVDNLIFNTATISIFGFLTLYWFEVRSIRELGILSASGVMYLYILNTVIVPSVFKAKPKMLEIEPGRYSKVIGLLSDGCTWLALKNYRIYAWSVSGLFSLAVVLILSGFLRVGTKPLEYLPGKMPYRVAEYLNQEGRSGFASLSIYVESEYEDGIHDPQFIKAVSEFQKDLYGKGARVVFSTVDFVQKISLLRDGRNIPLTKEDADAVFFFLEQGTEDEIEYQMWTKEGVRILAFIEMDNSIEIGDFNKSVVDLGNDKKYVGMGVYPFGDAALYPREDRYITFGKPINAGSGEFVIFFFCVLLIATKSRRLKSTRLSPGWGGFIMSVPFIFASSVTALLMMALRMFLDIATSMITALAINASIDFSIYFVNAYQEALVRTDKDNAIRLAMRDMGEIIINDIFLNSVCFSPLMLSQFIPVKRLGWMMVVMIIACGFGSLVIMPSLLRRVVDRTKRNKNRKE